MPTPEKQFDLLLNVVLETQADVKKLNERTGSLETAQERMEVMQERILVVTLDTQTDVKELKQRTGWLEAAHEKTFSRLDDFLTIMRRHDDEIMATRNTCDRLSGRVDKLEKLGA